MTVMKKRQRKHLNNLLRYYDSYQLYSRTYALETGSSCGLEIKLEGDQYYLKTSKREQKGGFEIQDGYITFQRITC